MFRYPISKAIQAAGVLLEQQSHASMEYIRLLKLLYIADRISLQETGVPIVGNRVVAMKHGPLHSNVYDLIRGSGIGHQDWAEYFHTGGYSIYRKSDPGIGALSKYEIDVLSGVSQDYQHTNAFDLCDATHEFEEYKRNFVEGTSSTIRYEDVLSAVGRGDEIADITEEDQDDEELRRLIG
jgi:uncharacterized phage-associated protein